ncbi:MAG: hypothetical protein J6A58_02970 [Oscillospiraceae bacterium]|nr:hypothetical protein [Oscillospiraceae bacterium]
MNKKINYILCLAMSLLMFSCDKKEEIKIPESKNETEFVTEEKETETDLSVNYYKAEKMYKSTNSNDVIGFYNGHMYTDERSFNENCSNFKSYKIGDIDHNKQYSIKSEQFPEDDKIRCTGLLQAREETADAHNIHIKDMNTNKENIISIPKKDGYYIKSTTAVNTDTVFVYWNADTNDDRFISVYNSKGEETSTVKPRHANTSVFDVVVSTEGRVFTYINDTKMCFDEISPEEIKFIDTPITINQDDYILKCFDGNETYDFFYSTETSIYGVDIENNKCKRVLDINHSDLPYDVSIFNFCQVDDKTMYISTAQSIYKLTKDDSVPVKTEY